tara:strand:- start:1280 stop:1921 length:642 start_codon:yes stop_codon:yes gene_type:complete
MKYPEFTIDQTNLPVIKHLIKIITDPKEKKGLILHGAVGIGKTALILVWLDFRQTVLSYGEVNQRSIDQIEAGWSEEKLTVDTYAPTELVSRVAKDGYSFFDELGHGPRTIALFIDDMGLATTVTHFGTQINVIEQLIYSRYETKKFNPNLEFYGTTNLTWQPLRSLMGDRAWSRLMEMANWNEGLLTGEDRREKAGHLKQWPKFSRKRNLSI